MVICFGGFKGSGKDAMAAYLVKKHSAKRVALADPLKDSVSEEFGIARGLLDDPKLKESPILTMPVDPKDDFSKMIAKFMFKEFRTADNEQPDEFTFRDGKMLGVINYLTGWDFKPLFQTPRSLAILKGSTNRSVTSDYWTNKAFQNIDHYLNDYPIVVVTDLRYRSELAQFKERYKDQVVFIRINRHKESLSQDPSEMDLVGAQFDFHIDNTGTLENSYAQLEDIGQHLIQKSPR